MFCHNFDLVFYCCSDFEALGEHFQRRYTPFSFSNTFYWKMILEPQRIFFQKLLIVLFEKLFRKRFLDKTQYNATSSIINNIMTGFDERLQGFPNSSYMSSICRKTTGNMMTYTNPDENRTHYLMT